MCKLNRTRTCFIGFSFCKFGGFSLIRENTLPRKKIKKMELLSSRIIPAKRKDRVWFVTINPKTDNFVYSFHLFIRLYPDIVRRNYISITSGGKFV